MYICIYRHFGTTYQSNLPGSSSPRRTPAKPSQSVNWGLRFAQSASRCPPVCQPSLLLTASLGSITDSLTLTEEFAYANDFKVRLRALTDLLKTSAWVAYTNYGRDKLWLVGWLAAWVLSPDCLSRKSEFCRVLRGSRHGRGGECGPCPDCIIYIYIP